jgi:hypothetical protein
MTGSNLRWARSLPIQYKAKSTTAVSSSTASRGIASHRIGDKTPLLATSSPIPRPRAGRTLTVFRALSIYRLARPTRLTLVGRIFLPSNPLRGKDRARRLTSRPNRLWWQDITRRRAHVTGTGAGVMADDIYGPRPQATQVRNVRSRPMSSVTLIRPARKLSADKLPPTAMRYHS